MGHQVKKTTYWVNMQDNAQHNVQLHIKKKYIEKKQHLGGKICGENMTYSKKQDIEKRTHWEKNIPRNKNIIKKIKCFQKKTIHRKIPLQEKTTCPDTEHIGKKTIVLKKTRH